MSQKTNKIIVLIAVVIFAIFTIGVIRNRYFIGYKQKNIIKFGFEIKGRDPDTGKNDLYIPLEGVAITAKVVKDDKVIDLGQRITNKEGKVVFEIEKGYSYGFFITPLSSLSSLYDYSDFPYLIQKTDNFIEGEFIIEKKLDLLPEVKRDIQRRNDLLVIKEALEEYKKEYGQFPRAIYDTITPESTTYLRIKPYLKDANKTPFDPLPAVGRFYEYYSDKDGSEYLLIAYPEKDFRENLELLSTYKGQKVYLIKSTQENL